MAGQPVQLPREVEARLPRLFQAVRALGKFALQQQSRVSLQTADVKGRNELVTFVDRALEEQLTKILTEEVWAVPVLGEEQVGKALDQVPEMLQRHEWWWILDPLDGTTNYIHGLPCYAISIALFHAPTQQVVLGIVYAPPQDELFWARIGEGAYRNDQPIRVADHAMQKHFLIATGFPYTNFSRIDPYMRMLRRLMEETQGVRRMGSAAIDLAYTACGRFDGFFEYGLKIWDVAAGALLVQEAGGGVADFEGGRNYLLGGEILAGSAACFRYLLKRASEYFGSVVIHSD